ncbi:MAG: hypothetical protein IJ895_01515 [Prevotella sp.]|nr:hypothetical protein [Prevotella sp.]
MKNGNNRYFPVTHVDYVVYDKERRLSAKDVFEQIVPVALTYEELVELRTAGHLTQGQTYRITDYVTTTVAAGTQSAGHPFDVIVVALGNNVLSEEAWAILHDGDTYFQNCKLQAWKLKYCLDNDTTRFAWANAQNGKGVIYWMRDEFGNECPYDFKNIMFARYKITAIKGTATDLVNQYLGFADIQNSSVVYPSGATLSTTAVYRYTFDYLSGTTSRDTSIYQMSQSAIKVHDNEIMAYFVDKKQQLNNITAGGTSFSDCYGNVFETQNRNWAISGSVYGNHVGSNGYNNSVGNWFNYNTVGNDFYSNSVGYSFQYNSVGNGFGSNTVGNWFTNNSVGNSCSSNTIADNVIGANFLDGITGKNIAPVTLDTFDYDYGSWIEGDEDEDGDTLVSGFEGGYFEIAFADGAQHSCHLVVAARHAGGTEVIFDQDITTESDGTYRLEDLSADWDECKGSMCCYSVEAKWTDADITQRKSDYSSY